jgi:uncharacterized protein (TIGR03067 family)
LAIEGNRMIDTRHATDAEAIQGTWFLCGVRTANGEQSPDHPDNAAAGCWLFGGDGKLTRTFAPDPGGTRGGILPPMTFTQNTEVKPPTLDADLSTGAEDGPVRMLYELRDDGATLRVCYNLGRLSRRPMWFGVVGRQVVLTLRRHRPKPG